MLTKQEEATKGFVAQAAELTKGFDAALELKRKAVQAVVDAEDKADGDIKKALTAHSLAVKKW